MNNRYDARVIVLLEQILGAIETLNSSIQEFMRNANYQLSPSSGCFTPPAPPPSRASSTCSTGITSNYSTLSGALQRVSLQDNKYHGRNIPCPQRWYCVIRGQQVGPIQGWENVEEMTDGLADAKYQRCVSESEAQEVYERALQRPGNVRVLN